MIRRFPIANCRNNTRAEPDRFRVDVGRRAARPSRRTTQLKTALAGDPVEVTQKVVLVRLTSSADAMFPSGGWQVPSNVPLLDKMLPTLSKLQNTKIVVAGYTDNVPIGAELKAKGVSTTSRLVCRTGRRHRELPHLAWRQGGSHLGPRVRGNRPSGVERHTGRTGEEPSGRHSC